MKNSISRRSFLKKSTVAAVAAANSSLLTGLTSAAAISDLCTEYRINTVYFAFLEPTYATEAEAWNAANATDPWAYATTPSDKEFVQYVECEGYTEHKETVTEGSVTVRPTLTETGMRYVVIVLGDEWYYWCEW